MPEIKRSGEKMRKRDENVTVNQCLLPKTIFKRKTGKLTLRHTVRVKAHIVIINNDIKVCLNNIIISSSSSSSWHFSSSSYFLLKWKVLVTL